MRKSMVGRNIIDGLEGDGLSEEEIAYQLGITRMGLYKIRKRNGWDKKHGRSDKGRHRVDPEVSRQKKNLYMREYQRKIRKKNGSYKNIRVTIDGISVVRQEHRVIAEKVLGRSLKSSEIVHHIDGNVRNNERGNLVICDQDYHINVLHKI